MNQNFLDLLQLFEEHKVKYLIIGGYAVSFYSEPRYTKDIDFWIECSLSNGKRLIKALDEFGAPLAAISAKDFATKGTAYTAGLPPLRFDILTRIPGALFENAFKSRTKIRIGKTNVNYISFTDLLKVKAAAGRPQDKLDLEKLKKFKPILTTKNNKKK